MYYNETEENNFGEVLYSALPVLKEINDLYNAAESIRQRTDIRHTNRKAMNIKTARIKAGALVVVPWLIFSLIFSRIIDHVKSQVLITAIGILVYGGSAAAIIIYFLLKKHFTNLEPSETNEDITSNKQLVNISDRIYTLSLENGELLEKIPKDYRCYDAVLFMERALRNGRADNKKEAINLYEEELHRRRLETNSAVSIKIQREQCRMLSDIEYNSHRAAVNSGIAATFSILSYLSRD